MRNRLKQIIKLLRVSLFYLVRYLSYLIPKKNNIWVFVGWRRNKNREIFAENTKYFFLYTHNNLKNIRPIWIGMDKKICQILNDAGYEAYPIYSLAGIYYSLRAKLTIISGLLQIENWRLSGGSKIIQLWHGKSLKKTGYSSPYSLQRYKKFLDPNLFHPVDKFVAISDFLANFVVSDFNVPREDIIATGIPKYDALIGEIDGANIDIDIELDNLIKTIRAKQPNRLFFYGPTFRPDGSNPLGSIDLEILNKKLVENNDQLIISLHPKFSTRDWIPDSVKITNIYFSQGDMDKYPIMHKFDALITDYSSLAFDFLYMNKPVIFFAYDLHTYDKEMGVYEELWSIMPDTKVFNFEDLIKILDQDLSKFQSQIEKTRNVLFDFTDTDSSKRIAEKITVLGSIPNVDNSCNYTIQNH